MNTGVFDPDVILIWGCNWRSQYERDWLLDLLRPCLIDEYDWFNSQKTLKLHKHSNVILIESGIHLLQSKVNTEDISELLFRRSTRIKSLSNLKKLSLIHLSDEEGLDGRYLYKEINPSIRIWRTFYHEEFSSYNNISNLPLGPTRISLSNLPFVPSNKRKYIWNFIGTSWQNSDRERAISIFKSILCDRNYVFVGDKFGRGKKQNEYINILIDSVFTLCPGGNRHFETFRFYETLEMGSIPLVVNSQKLFDNSSIFQKAPIDSFDSWENAAKFAKYLIKDKSALEVLQLNLRDWWKNAKWQFSLQLKQMNS